ncbi:hypothetical protein EDB86DRAFT_3249476 [Lactarius hatsudake]|nr:hypothetical protein EDB86DRAFT_3249476 [Lactarius hatsudake]
MSLALGSRTAGPPPIQNKSDARPRRKKIDNECKEGAKGGFFCIKRRSRTKSGAWNTEWIHRKMALKNFGMTQKPAVNRARDRADSGLRARRPNPKLGIWILELAIVETFDIGTTRSAAFLTISSGDRVVWYMQVTFSYGSVILVSVEHESLRLLLNDVPYFVLMPLSILDLDWKLKCSVYKIWDWGRYYWRGTPQGVPRITLPHRASSTACPRAEEHASVDVARETYELRTTYLPLHFCTLLVEAGNAHSPCTTRGTQRRRGRCIKHERRIERHGAHASVAAIVRAYVVLWASDGARESEGGGKLGVGVGRYEQL